MRTQLRWRGAGVQRLIIMSAATALVGAGLVAVAATPANAQTPPGTSSGSPVVTSVSRSTDKLDVFGVDTHNRIYTKGWSPSTGWSHPVQINGGVAATGTSVYGVSRRTDYLDVFAVGGDHQVYTAAWTPSSGGWQGWWALGGITVAPNTSVHAVSVTTDRLDVFAVGSDYGIYTDGWSPSTGWSGWIRVLGGVAAPGTTVFGVSRESGYLDIFAVGSDHSVITAARPSPSSPWAGWWGVAGGVVAPNTSVYPVSRSLDHLDVFAVGTDHHVYTAAWEPSFTDGFHGWWAVGGQVVAPDTSVFGVSRSTDHLDVFAVGTDHHVYTAAWEPAFTDGFHGWWAVAGGVVANGTSVFGVSRSTDHLDVFAVDTNLAVDTAAWEPAFSDGFHGWWNVYSGQLSDTSLIFDAPISFDVAADGWATLSVFSDGSYNFTGHFEATGAWEYNTSFVWALRSASGTVFTFADTGHIAGWAFPGSSTHDFNVSGKNPAIAAAWSDLQAGYSHQWGAKVDFDLAGLWSEIKTAIGYISTVVTVVGPLL